MELSCAFVSMDKQELFDRVVENLAVQGIRCDDGYGGCVYLDDEKNRCGVGWCLTDSFIQKAADIGGPIGPMARYSGLKLDDEFAMFLISIQKVHDSAESRYKLVQAFRALAKTYRLSTESLDAAMPPQWCAAEAWVV